MAAFNNQREDGAPDEEQQPSPPSSWDRPLLLAGLGLVLMLGGYAALNYVLIGRLALFGGLILFILAGILMYRSSPSTKDVDARK